MKMTKLFTWNHEVFSLCWVPSKEAAGAEDIEAVWALTHIILILSMKRA